MKLVQSFTKDAPLRGSEIQAPSWLITDLGGDTSLLTTNQGIFQIWYLLGSSPVPKLVLVHLQSLDPSYFYPILFLSHPISLIAICTDSS